MSYDNSSPALVKSMQIYFKPMSDNMTSISILGKNYESETCIKEIVIEKFVFAKKCAKNYINVFIKNGGSSCIKINESDYKKLLAELFLNMSGKITPVSRTIYDYINNGGKGSDFSYDEKFHERLEAVKKRLKS